MEVGRVGEEVEWFYRLYLGCRCGFRLGLFFLFYGFWFGVDGEEYWRGLEIGGESLVFGLGVFVGFGERGEEEFVGGLN